MKGRLVAAFCLSAAMIGVMVWLIVSSVQSSFAYDDMYHEGKISVVFWLSAVALFVLGIVILAMNKGEVRGIGISIGVLSILTPLIWPIAIAVAIVSIVGISKLR